MKETITLVFILTLMASSLIVLENISAQTGTNVSGVISQDTTWTKARSPYQLTGPITINGGTTLSVEAGTTVNLDRYTIQILGTLSAKGSSLNNIYLKGFSDSSSYQIIFNQSSTSWNSQTSSGSIIENCVVDVASIFIDTASPKINHNSIGGANIDGKVPAVISVHGGSPVISNNTITSSFKNYAIEIIGGTPIVSNNHIVNPYSVWSGIYISGKNSAIIYGNSIVGSETGRFAIGIFVRDGTATIERNNIENNAVGIAIDGDSQIKVVIQNNTVTKNEIAIRFGNNYDSSSSLRFNNIELGSSTWAGPRLVDLDGFIGPSYTINAVNNWWGTTDAEAVRQSVNSGLVTQGLGGSGNSVSAIVIPILSSPNPQAFPEIVDLPEAIPYPSPYPTALPSQTTLPTNPPSPTQIESPTSSSTPTITSTSGNGYPSIPFLMLTNTISLIVIAILLVVIIALLLLMRQRKIK